jgi:hypothetical protein
MRLTWLPAVVLFGSLATIQPLAAEPPSPATSGSAYLGVLDGAFFIANDVFGLRETLGRYQIYRLLATPGGYQGRLDWRGWGITREYSVHDETGRLTGSIEYFAGRFDLYDPSHALVGRIEGPQGFLGRYFVTDTAGAQVGTLDSPFGDGQSFNIRGDQRTVDLFARIGLDLGPAPARETARAARFDALHALR